MAIGVPVDIAASNTGNALTTAVVVTGVTTNAGQMILVMVGLSTGSTGTPFTCTDTAGNTYTSTAFFSGAAGKTIAFFCPNPIAMVAGVITIAGASGTPSGRATVKQISGLDLVSPLDVTAPGQSSSSSLTAFTSNVTTGTLNSASQIIVAFNNVPSAGTYKESGTSPSTGDTFNSLGASFVGSGNPEIHPAYLIVASTASKQYAPTWANAHTYLAQAWSFKEAAAPSSFNGLSLLGVGA